MKRQEFYIRTPRILSNALDAIKGLPVDGSWIVSIWPEKDTRRLRQNRTYWNWVADYSEYTGYKKNEVHAMFKQMYLPAIYLADPKGKDQIRWAAKYAAIHAVADRYDPEGVDMDANRMKAETLNDLSSTWASIQQFSEYMTEIDYMCVEKGVALRYPEDYVRPVLTRHWQ